MSSPLITIPQKSIGLRISVSSGTFDMTGLTANLIMEPNRTSNSSSVVTLPLTVQPSGLSGTYQTVGNEFPVPGFYNAQLKVTGNGVLFYSLSVEDAVLVQSVLG